MRHWFGGIATTCRTEIGYEPDHYTTTIACSEPGEGVVVAIVAPVRRVAEPGSFAMKLGLAE